MLAVILGADFGPSVRHISARQAAGRRGPGSKRDSGAGGSRARPETAGGFASGPRAAGRSHRPAICADAVFMNMPVAIPAALDRAVFAGLDGALPPDKVRELAELFVAETDFYMIEIASRR